MSDTQTRTEPLTLAPHEAALYLSALLEMRARWEGDGCVPSPMLQHQIRAVSRYLYPIGWEMVDNSDAPRIRWEAEAHWETIGDDPAA